jgi:glycosyltransferase involved in cell wall biosynthesis
MKIALISTGLGRVLRGFESFNSSLFQNLRLQAPNLNITLFQGGGKAGEGIRIVPNLYRGLTTGRLGPYRASLLEHRSFALGLYPLLRMGGFDIVHYNELALGSVLFHLRRIFGGRYKLLYCNGAPWMPLHYHHRCDFAQMLTAPMLDEALEYGIDKNRLFFVPYGVDGNQFSPAVRSLRAETRNRLGIPQDATVITTVAALNKWHKRIDHVMQEISTLPSSTWFLAAGQRTEETASLELEAERLLPSRWKFVSCPHDEVPCLLGATDLFVLGSLKEGLPISAIEAMLSGLPLVIHDGPLFQWAAQGARAWHVNMSMPGELKRAAQEALADTAGAQIEEPWKRFSWDALIPQYLQMYERVMQGFSAAA